jgi:hypothetical protein
VGINERKACKSGGDDSEGYSRLTYSDEELAEYTQALFDLTAKSDLRRTRKRRSS